METFGVRAVSPFRERRSVQVLQGTSYAKQRGRVGNVIDRAGGVDNGTRGH